MKEALRQRLARAARGARLLGLLDHGLFLADLARNRAANRRFRARSPGYPAPPASLMFEAYGHTDAERYCSTGTAHARHVAGILRTHLGRPSPRICEWGCGPGRVIRHLPGELGDPSARFFGTDCSAASLAWCRRHLPGVTFADNALDPPLPFDVGSFDAVYALSVFTHLGLRGWEAWTRELARVTAAGGVVIFSTHGRAYLPRLLPDERRDFLAGRPVFRAKTALGTKSFAAYHPPEFVRATLAEGLRLLDHEESPEVSGLLQDVWVARRMPGPAVREPGPGASAGQGFAVSKVR